MGAMNARERIEARRASIAANRSKGMRSYKFPAGKTMFRILPTSTDKGEPFERKYGKNYLKTFDGKSFFGIVDRSITYDEPSDPIRELIFDAMRQSPDQETKDHYKSMLGGTRYVFNALVLNDPNQKADEPVIIEVSEGAFDTIMAQFLVWMEEDPDYDLAALDTGHVFLCEKSGSGLDTKYAFTATPKKAPLDAKILDKAHDLDAWILSQVEGLEQKALAFLGQVNGAVGITTTTPTALIATNVTARPAATPANTGTAATVTTAIDNDDDEINTLVDAVVADTVIEDAVVEEVVEPTPAPTPTPTPTPAPAATAAPAADADGTSEIDDILAQLEGL